MQLSLLIKRDEMMMVFLIAILLLQLSLTNALLTLKADVKLCVVLTTSPNDYVIGASVRCNNSTMEYNTQLDGCTNMMNFTRTYPFTLSCEISGECIEKTVYEKSWSGSDWLEKQKSVQVEVLKNEESCVLSMSPSASPTKKAQSGNKNDAMTAIATSVVSVAFLALVAFFLKSCCRKTESCTPSYITPTGDECTGSCENICSCSELCCCCCDCIFSFVPSS